MREHASWITAVVAAVVVIVDQVTKLLVRTHMSPLGTSVPVIGAWLRLTFTRNEGAAFGMLVGGRVAFIVVSLIVLATIVGYLVRHRPERVWVVVALGLVAGGAVGNLIDRAWLGWVTDFIQIPFGFPIFNAADSSVVVGVAMLIWWLLFGSVTADAQVDDAHADGVS